MRFIQTFLLCVFIQSAVSGADVLPSISAIKSHVPAIILDSSVSSTKDANQALHQTTLPVASNNQLTDIPVDQLTNVSIDHQLLILKTLDELDALSLVNLTQAALTNEHLNRLAGYVYKRRINQVLIGGYSTEVRNHQAIINDLDFAHRFLKAFGSLITTLKIDYSKIPLDNQTAISSIVNEYCSKALTELEVDGTVYQIAMMASPFKIVSKIIFENHEKMPLLTVDSDLSTKFDQTFPKLRHLDLSAYTRDRHPFGCRFPELVEVHLGRAVSSQSYYNLLAHNPQIRKLTATEINLEFLANVSTLLAELDEFVIGINYYFTPTGVPIHFDAVQKVSIHVNSFWNSVTALQGVTFGGLKSLDILLTNYRAESLTRDNMEKVNSEWIQFISKHDKLQKLTVTNAYFDETTVKQLSTVLNDLVMVDFTCGAFLMTDTIRRFLESKPKLAQCILRFPTHSPFMFNSVFDNLHDKLNTTWLLYNSGIFKITIRRNTSVNHVVLV